MRIVKPGAIIIEGHVQGLSNTRSLGRTGIPVIVLDKSDCISKYSKYCHHFFKCPDFLDKQFIFFLIGLKEQHGLDGWLLLPSNDHAVYNISLHRPMLESHFKIITPHLDVIETIYDKIRLIELAKSIRLPVPKTFSGENFNNSARGFPVITKGRQGLSFYKTVGTKGMFSQNPKELKNNLRDIGNRWPLEQTFTQEVIPFDGTNRTISFTAFCIEGEIKTFWMGVKLREHPARFGTATFAQSIYQPECYELSVPLLKVLKYTGICEVEYLKDPRDGKFKLIELNPRTWLWVGLAEACGVNFVKIAYEYVNGIPIEYTLGYKTGLCWINPWTDLLFSLQALLKGKLKLGPYINSLRKNKLVSLFSKRDPYPFFVYLLLTYNYLRSR